MALPIYLDNCTLCRPEDRPTALVAKQAEAVLDILEGVRQQRFELVTSSMHYAEAAEIEASSPDRFALVMARLGLAGRAPLDSADSTELYELLRRAPRGKAPLLKPKDGLHVASAVLHGAAVLITVDRKLYLWCRAHRSLLQGMAAMRPGEFLARFGHAKASREEE